MSEEWGPWIEHDGKGCPCFGAWVRCEWEGPPGRFMVDEGRAGSMGGGGWDWSNFQKRHHTGRRIAVVRRYRIRKPRGLTILEELIEQLPELEDA